LIALIYAAIIGEMVRAQTAVKSVAGDSLPRARGADCSGAANRRSIALCSWGGDLPLPKSDKKTILISNRQASAECRFNPA
jgi:hypothetical protein